LNNMVSLIDKNTVAIVVLNPSNPCGSVYSKNHLLDIIKIAQKNKLPIIADEVYGDMVGNKHYLYIF
jgi:tyrosine aminotransferase